MNSIESSRDARTEQLVDRMLAAISGELTSQERTILWADQVLEEYNSLQKDDSGKKTKELISQTSRRLLENPQDIAVASSVWKSSGVQESFYDLVKQEASRDVRKKWERIRPDQLSQFVKCCSENSSVCDFASTLLTNYFKSPNSRNQRVIAYYNFVSGVIDLAEEDEAFKEGVKIALHATEVLPKNPNLIEQTVLLSLPYDLGEKVLQKLLISKYVLSQISFMRIHDFVEYHRESRRFMLTDSEAVKEWDKRKKNIEVRIGRDEAMRLNNIMMDFSHVLEKPLSIEKKQELKDVWPYNLAFDDNDPLNQKFNRTFSNSGI